MLSAQAREEEFAHRARLWQDLQAAGGPNGVRPELVKRLRLHIGQQGVFRDLDRTRGLGGSMAGVAVGVLHTGRTYSDDLSENGLTYHYPDTGRGQRDANEVRSIKACRDLSLPLFVVITPYPKAPIRNVRLGWVVDSDDRTGLLLIVFADNQPHAGLIAAEAPFNLFETRSVRRTPAKTRPNQWRFRFDVIKRYGLACALCEICDYNLLDAAHLCPVESGGSDDSRNGLVFCLNHHRAFDRGLVRIDPSDLSVSAPGTLGVTRRSLRHLPNAPHQQALTWAWNRATSALALAVAS